MGELPNSHGRTLTDKLYVLHGIPYKSRVFGFRNPPPTFGWTGFRTFGTHSVSSRTGYPLKNAMTTSCFPKFAETPCDVFFSKHTSATGRKIMLQKSTANFIHSSQLQKSEIVIPAKAGIHSFQGLLDPRFREGDTFLLLSFAITSL